jgi:ATP-binding cassette, subfamily B, bacterial
MAGRDRGGRVNDPPDVLGELCMANSPLCLGACWRNTVRRANLGREWQPFEALEVVDLTYVHRGSERGGHRITFQVRRGERVLVTGRVASGKTTLLRALLGVLPCQSGSVLWNGHLVKDPAAYLVPPRCAYTPQVPRLFSDSLQRNLLLGLDGEEVDLERAVAVPQFGADLSALRAGLESEVGARGVALSGGQMQHAALARMLVRPAHEPP